MRTLIIIGNGFDLAHGLKSSFKDFLEYYLKKSWDIFLDEESYKDELFEIKYKNQYEKFHPAGTTDKIFEYYKLLETSPLIEIKYSDLIKESLEKINLLSWVDLEMEFFQILSISRLLTPKSISTNKIKEINNQLEKLRVEFLSYLEIQMSEYTHKLDYKILSSFPTIENFDDEILFLNFNYTNIAEKYAEKVDADHIYIHGDLEETQGEPIFGFGDEHNKKYLEFEDDNNNELFHHIKSFGYLKNKGYKSLLGFIDRSFTEGGFDIHIYGHSCGLSDRTLLKFLFEHDICNKIQIFYYGTPENNDYTDKTYEISRHFTDKNKLREKLISEPDCVPMPQPKDSD